MLLRCVSLIMLFLLSIPAVFAAKAEYKEVLITYGKDMAGQPNAKSVEIPITGVNGLLINATAAGYTVQKMGTQKGGDFRLVITKNNGTLPDGGQITVKITGLDMGKVSPGTPIWSDDNGGLIGTTDKTKVTTSNVKGDPIYTLSNEMTPSTDIRIGELHLYYNHDPVDPDTADPLVWVSNPSLVVSMPFDLNGFGASTNFTIPDIQDDKRFLVQGRIIDASGNVIGAFLDSYTSSAVPEPSAWLVFASAGACLLALCGRRWGRQRTVVCRMAVAITLCAALSLSESANAQVFYQQPAQYHSYLVSYAAAGRPAEISDAQLATWVGGAINPNGNRNISDADFFFQQCFGGGMIDDLLPKFGNAIPYTAASAASWGQVALATPPPSPFVQPQYATWSAALLPQLNNRNLPVLTAEARAFQNDFYGPNGFYRETPNFLSGNGGNALTLADPNAAKHYAVIFDGDVGVFNTASDARKLGQSQRNVISDFVSVLNNAWAGTNYQIAVLFGDGTAATAGVDRFGNNLGLRFNNAALGTTLLAANPGNLQNTLANLGNGPNDQLVFFGFDHGDISNNYKALLQRLNRGGRAFDTFSLEDPNSSDPNPNPDGELIDIQTEEDMADPAILDFTYAGLDPTTFSGSIDVFVNGVFIGSLDPTLTEDTVNVPVSLLLDDDTISVVNNSNQDFDLISQMFRGGALPLEVTAVPEPSSVAICGIGVLCLLGFAYRRRRAGRNESRLPAMR